MAAEVSFIKLRNTGSGAVEAHLDALEGSAYKRVADYTSDFSPADANNGAWQLFGSQNGAPMLGFIKLQNAGGTVEVHWDVLQGGAYKRVADYTSDFRPADAGNGVWQLLWSPDGTPILGFIKLRNVGSGTVEVHWDALKAGSYKRVADYTSDFSPADAGNGVWQLLWSPDGTPMLGFIKLRNTNSGRVEVHWDALKAGSYKRIADYTSDFSPADANNGAWQLFGSQNGAPMLGFIKLQNTGGTIEMHWDALSGGSYKRAGDYTSDFSPADASNGAWQFVILAPTVVSVRLGASSRTGITLIGVVDPQGSATTYHFDYGTTTNYGLSAPVPDGLAGSAGQVTVSQAITGLQPGTPYHARLVAENVGGISFGNDAVFSTAAATYTPHGYSSIVVYNGLDSGGSMALWAWDLTVGGPWQNVGSTPYQNSNGSQGYVKFVPSADTHSYQLWVIDLTLYPDNDPYNNSWVWELPAFKCDPRGPAYPNQTAQGE